MLRSLFSAISGLQAHQTKMDVTGNNIANVNTVGYKSQTTVFEDTLSQMLRNGSAPTGDDRRHQPGPGRPRREGRRHRHQLHPGLRRATGRVDRLHDQRRRVLRHQAGQPAALHPRRLVRLRRQPAGWSPPTAASCRAGWPTQRHDQHQRAARRPHGALRPDDPAGGDHDRHASRATCPRRPRRRGTAVQTPGHDVRPARATRTRSATRSPRPPRPTPGRSTSRTRTATTLTTDRRRRPTRRVTVHDRRQTDAAGDRPRSTPSPTASPAGPGRSPST